MTLLAIALMWIVGSLIMASDGDYSGLKAIGTVLIYVVAIGLFLWFLAVTGVAGLFIFVAVTILIALAMAQKKA